jgi:hypothetical protein
MADLSKIKVGDKLRLEVTVTDLDRGDERYPVAIDRGQWLDGKTIEAAEHIEAPRVFRRGDWVKWNDGEEDFRHCIVLGKSETGHSELLRVDVPGEGVCELYPRFLEPDEAPE